MQITNERALTSYPTVQQSPNEPTTTAIPVLFATLAGADLDGLTGRLISRCMPPAVIQ